MLVGSTEFDAMSKSLLMVAEGANGFAVIETLDADLVSTGERRLLQFTNTFASLEHGMHINLHNNICGTNFPMWYGEDTKFRYRLALKSW